MTEESKREDRVILHCDANSFFASVELTLRPELKELPVVVSGNEASRHGIVLAKNQSAARYGIKTAETVFSARKKCPQLICIPPHYEEYARFSRALNCIYQRYTDLVEPFGIDESWLDVTGSRRLFGTGEMIAERIRQTVKRELGITVSVGVSFNKVFAKLGSDYRKPDAVTVINRESVERMVYPLPASSMIFVGKKTADLLEKNGIRTLGELASASPIFLTRLCGKLGEQLSSFARGEDTDPVQPYYIKRDKKSIGNGMTFSHDLVTEDEVLAELFLLADDVGVQLRREKKKCATLCLALKDEFLHTVTRQRSLSSPTNLTRALAEEAMAIFRAEWPKGKPVRALTVTAMNLLSSDEAPEQISFLSEDDGQKTKKQQKIEETMDALCKKYGQHTLHYAAMAREMTQPSSQSQGIKNPNNEEKI